MSKQYRVAINLQELIDDGYVPKIGDVVYDGSYRTSVYDTGLTIVSEMEPRRESGNYLILNNPRYRDPDYRIQSLAKWYYQFRMVTIVDQSPA